MTDFSLENISTAALEGRPRHRYLPNISFAVNYYFGRLNPFGYHVVNLAIHLLTGIFLFLFIRLTLRIYPRTFSVGSGVNPRPEREGINPSPTMTEKIINTAESSPELIAFCAALLWLVQPVGTQAVTYICQRMASMVAMFYILSLLLYVRGRMAMMEGRKTLSYDGGDHEDWVAAPLQSSALHTVGAGFTPARIQTGGHKALPYGKNGRGRILARILYFTGCALAALCAFATKENAGTLPIVILLYEWFFFQDLKLQWSRRQFVWAGIFVLIFLAGVFWYMGENPFNRLFNSYNRRDFTMIERVMTELRIVVYYISLFLWAPPGRLNLDHDYPLSVSPMAPAVTIAAFLAIIALLWFSVYTAKKHRLMAFAVLWFFLTQATESTIIGIELIFEHRTYLPFMMVSLMLVLMVCRFMREGIKPSPTSTEATPSPRRGGVYPRPGKSATSFPALPNPDKPHLRLSLHQTAPWCLLLAIAAIFSFWTWQRNTDWKDPVFFYTDSTLKSPQKYRPYNNLGTAYLDLNQAAFAIAPLQKALRIKPDYLEALFNLGSAYQKINQPEHAIQYYSRVLTLNANHLAARNNLANLFMSKGKPLEAIHHFENIIDLKPNHVEANVNLGAALTRVGRIDEALIYYRRAIENDLYNAEAHNNIGVLYAKKNMLDAARHHFQKAIDIRPGYQSPVDNLNRLNP